MFRALAPEYDRWNRVLSLGLDQPWRRRAVAELAGCRRVCDLGAGTGDMSVALFSYRAFKGSILAVDPTRELWHKSSGKAVLASARCRFALAEGEHLPLADGSCDAVMSGFVMRNFFDLELALRECSRVVSPGGRAVFLEMGHPRSKVWHRLFSWYFGRWMPFLFGRVAQQGAAYRYLPESLARFPPQDEVVKLFLANGWKEAGYNEYFGGAVVAYRATR
jgi:demethylmenaquinone methyltransferase/2-methoxy-6-polyprenyl-1,4-benzoquinol methylase